MLIASFLEFVWLRVCPACASMARKFESSGVTLYLDIPY